MRKSKLIILPTKCLNQMGFLLLFLSCPVIGDWGRIRPDSEMSQWSILIEREGSCGLVRNSPEKEAVQDGWMECQATSVAPQNDSLQVIGNSKQIVTRMSKISSRIQGETERRLARRDVRERRTASLERRATIRHIDNSRRNERAASQEYRRMNDVRRLSLDRRVRNNNEGTGDNSERRMIRENDLRRVENSAASRRVQERRVSRRVENDDAAIRRASIERRSASRVRVETAGNRNVHERRERREELRRTNGDRRSLVREELQSRRRDNTDERRLSGRRVDMRRDSFEERASDARRTMRRITIQKAQSEPDVRRSAATADARRSERSVQRREVLLKAEDRRIVADLSRRQDARVGKLREREANTRERMVRADRYNRIESLTLKQKKLEETGESKWQFLDGIKNWFHQKTDRENWMANNDLATTCLVGAAVYLLTTRQIKTV